MWVKNFVSFISEFLKSARSQSYFDTTNSMLKTVLCPAVAATIFAWEIMTPFGLPVVPDVYIVMARSSGLEMDSTSSSANILPANSVTAWKRFSSASILKIAFFSYHWNFSSFFKFLFPAWGYGFFTELHNGEFVISFLLPWVLPFYAPLSAYFSLFPTQLNHVFLGRVFRLNTERTQAWKFKKHSTQNALCRKSFG